MEANQHGSLASRLHEKTFHHCKTMICACGNPAKKKKAAQPVCERCDKIEIERAKNEKSTGKGYAPDWHSLGHIDGRKAIRTNSA
jgi:hypothetical protein